MNFPSFMTLQENAKIYHIQSEALVAYCMPHVHINNLSATKQLFGWTLFKFKVIIVAQIRRNYATRDMNLLAYIT